ncbi:hypothetical protein C8T65DRAFT_710664 [Cerioporus squamosus]|nr:hypothetical protein C8T65DRAFT_710664 [Cerioporus squamosus]
MGDWTATVYAFYDPRPKIFIKGTRVAHVFKCLAPKCKLTEGVKRWQDTGDRSSTSGLKRHAETCWGAEAVKAVLDAESVQVGRDEVVGGILRTGSITAFFPRKKGQVSFSHRQHTKAETRTEVVRWVCENVRPFKIVRDRGFMVLMKTGRPGYFLPSPATVSRDVKTVFARTRVRIAKMLQEYEGALSFATDAWTAPNHRSANLSLAGRR